MTLGPKQTKQWLDTAREHGWDFDKIPEIMITPNAKKPKVTGPISVDLFAGIGGVALGFQQAGIHTPVSVDIDEWSMLTYMVNLGKNPNKPVAYIRKDIRNVKGTEIIEMMLQLGYEPFIDILHTSPPCTDFSTANSKRVSMGCGWVGSRYCVLESVRLIRELRPKYFTLENVPGMIRYPLRPLFDQFLFEMRQAGYNCTWKILNAADFGVPQNRPRVFVIGFDDMQYFKTDPWTFAKAKSIEETFEGMKLLGNPDPDQALEGMQVFEV